MSLVKYDEDSRVLVKKAQSGYRPLKRPAVVLEEDAYIDGLSEVIKRNFFPDLLAAESKYNGQELHNGQRQRQSEQNYNVAETPRVTSHRTRSDTPESVSLQPLHELPAHFDQEALAKNKLNTNLSLSAFQAKYTSEDNASFLAILDKQNLLNREKYSWHYNENKMYSENTKRQDERILLERQSEQKKIGWIDDRKNASGWATKPKNSLMFDPDAIPFEEQDDTTREKRVHEVRVSHNATRLHKDRLISGTNASTSSSRSRIRRAMDGQIDSASDSDDEPRINGYTFVDEPDTPMETSDINPFPESLNDQSPKTPNPFKIPETPARDQLLERLVTKQRRATTPRATSVLRRTIATPKFKSSPVLSPAARRMIGAGTGLRERLKTPGKSKLR